MASYGTTSADSRVCDYNFLRYSGWQETNVCLKKLYHPSTIKVISDKVTQLTQGVDPKNRAIVVSKEQICNIIDSVYTNYRPAVGDIFTRYIVPNTEQQDEVQSIIDQTIEIIVNFIRSAYEMDRNNFSLTPWVQVYGDFNKEGLRQHSPIKTKDRRASTMQFHMNY